VFLLGYIDELSPAPSPDFKAPAFGFAHLAAGEPAGLFDQNMR